jgi:hypothetical protein
MRSGDCADATAATCWSKWRFSLCCGRLHEDHGPVKNHAPEVRIEPAEELALQSVRLSENSVWHSLSFQPEKLGQAVYGVGDVSVYELIMSRQVDVASGSLCERKEFSRRILPLRSAERLMERAPSIYYGLGYAILLGIVHRMLPWRLATQALDSTVTFLNTTDCQTGRRARQPRPAQIPTSWALCW